MAKIDPQIVAHLEWLGFVRPTGLVVSAPALVRAGAILDQRDAEGQRLLRSGLRAPERAMRERAPAMWAVGGDAAELRISDFRHFAGTVLGWRFSPKGYAGTPEVPIPPELEVVLPDGGGVLRPDFAVRELDPQPGAPAWQLLVRVLELGADFDREERGQGRLELSPHSRMERLLRQTGVPAGLLVNGDSLRLVSAPRAESSGWLDFRVADMAQTAGRPICTALRLLLSEQRLLALPRHQRLAALLADSRKFQNEVSEKLAEQVLHALYELLRGFQAAHDASKGALLRQVLAEHPDEVYRALLTVILRLVFLLYAEERDLLPEDETFLRYYSLAGLHERLREDTALYPDTMDQRYGAWAQLVALFRMVHDGAHAPGLSLPPRHGVLFDPDRFPFLEGRAGGQPRQGAERIEPPLVPDGTIYRALEKLLVLDGERISYRALDVEQIGSVYETMMGFRLETATGRSAAIKSQKKQGAPTALDLDALLAEVRANRAKVIQDRTDRKLSDKLKKAVVDADTLEALHAAMQPVIDAAATPDLVPRGAMVLQPSEARRRSGSHYTPRELTEPIVRTTLDPILARLRGPNGQAPRPEAILDLKVCDPAMGSGAFLVETCRYLADALVEAWRVHGGRPEIPPDEDEVVFARRLVAQRCLYGVDRNPVAVDLAKVSLWLVTLAKDHALTFLDHALRHGDSLVGLTRRQIENFHWDTTFSYDSPFRAQLREQVARVSSLRQEIREADESVSDAERRDLWDQAQAELEKVRLFADLAVAAFFDAGTPRERERKRLDYVSSIVGGNAERFRLKLEQRRHTEQPLAPFHWEIEFPEVFGRSNAGFDGFVGNPPFLGGTRMSQVAGMTYFQWLVSTYPPCAHHCDLVAYFFRRAFELLRDGGCFGFIATNTIAQGDTREGGLFTILQGGGRIYSATRRYVWPGQAAVVVSVVHVSKNAAVNPVILDRKTVDRVSAYLFPGLQDGSPARLARNPYFSAGSKIYGQGFLFDDSDPACTPTSVRDKLLLAHPDWANRIPPYIGGEEINSNPRQLPHRFVIYLSDVSQEEGLGNWPELAKIVEQKVKPERLLLGPNPNNVPLKRRWWAYQAHRPELYTAIAGLDRVLVISQTSRTVAFTFVPTGMVYSHKLVVFPFSRYAEFCAMQCRPHEIWARFFGSTMKDDAVYTPSDCFETFPFPENWQAHPILESAGFAYYDFRFALMVRNGEGLTTTYNRFHDPDERDPEILRLRELHSAMDRAVLDAYGWQDIATDCEFLLDYEIDEEEWGDKKKPWRYRWADDVRDDVLARLLELNAERARAEALAGAVKGSKRAGKRTAKPAAASPDIKDLFS